jgi:replicative DNA helicase
MGKTALALNITEQLAAGGVPLGGSSRGETVPVGLFSLEMSKSAVTSRMLSARSGVDSHKMRSGRFSDIDFRHLMQAVYELEKLPIYIDDTPAMSIHSLRARARRMKSKHGIGCVVVDYLQLLTAPQSSRESRQVEVSEISRGIKALARELKVPVVCLAQLNRGPEQRDGKQPRISDLRESGSIEQDADVVLLLHREEYYHLNDEDWALNNPDKVGLAELIVAKQRNGPTDVVRLTWDRATTRFKNHADARPPSGSQRWGTPEAAPRTEPKPPPPAPASGFGHRQPTGPVENHRDGGGPTKFDREGADREDEFEGDEDAPF